jgi:hypothetical protein
VRIVLGLLAGVCCAVVIACGAAAPKSSATMPPGADGGAGAGLRDPRIVELDRTIDTELQKLDLARPAASPPEPGCAPGCIQPMSVTAASDPQCHPASNDTCKQSCDIADAICNASSKICSIATELGGDAWANERCTSGKASCDAAHGKCCGCT